MVDYGITVTLLIGLAFGVLIGFHIGRMFPREEDLERVIKSRKK